MRRPLAFLHVAQELPQHVAEAEHGIDLQPVRLAVERRQCVIGAKNVARSVDQKDVVTGLGRAGFCCLRGFGHAPECGLSAA
jgi:hypothetical protein